MVVFLLQLLNGISENLLFLNSHRVWKILKKNCFFFSATLKKLLYGVEICYFNDI